ncbi:MAG: ABC transporter permease [Anaerolineae bacterium]
MAEIADPNVQIKPEPLSNYEEDAFALAPGWKLMWWRFTQHRLAVICLALFIPIIIIAFIPEFFATSDPEATFTRESYIPPQPLRLIDENGRFYLHMYAPQGERNLQTMRMEWQTNPEDKIVIGLFVRGFEYRLLGLIPTNIHLLGPIGDNAENERILLLGTDRLGRDLWSRLMYGTRISLSIGLVGMSLSLFLGVFIGGISGYFGGTIDLIIQRLIELLQSLPQIPLWLALSAALPQEWGALQIYFAISIILSVLGWTTLGREVRGRFLALREEDFVVAARLVGASQLRVILRHMVPAMTSHIIATATLAVPAMILSETALSFLGLGLRPPIISWGVLLQEGQNVQSVALAPWVLFPGVMVILVVLMLNIIGDGLRDAADPYKN